MATGRWWMTSFGFTYEQQTVSLHLTGPNKGRQTPTNQPNIHFTCRLSPGNVQLSRYSLIQIEFTEWSTAHIKVCVNSTHCTKSALVMAALVWDNSAMQTACTTVHVTNNSMQKQQFTKCYHITKASSLLFELTCYFLRVQFSRYFILKVCFSVNNQACSDKVSCNSSRFLIFARDSPAILLSSANVYLLICISSSIFQVNLD